MKSAVQPLLIVLVLGAGGFGLMQFREAQKMRVELEELGRDRDSLRGRLREMQRERTGPVAGAGTAIERPAEEPTGRPGEGAAQPAVAATAVLNRGRPDMRRFNAVMNSPEVQQLMAIQGKAGLDDRYAALFRRLNLSPAALDQLKHLLVEKQAVVMDVMAAARSQGMVGRENRDELRQLVESNQAEVDESIRLAIGDTAYAQYKNYETTMPQRGVVDQLSQRLSYSNTPLAEAQAEQMVRILAATAPSGNAGGQNGGMAPFAAALPRGGMAAAMGGGVRITDETVAQARGVLSAQQLAALQTLQQEQQAAASLMEKMRAGRQNTQPATVVPLNPSGG